MPAIGRGAFAVTVVVWLTLAFASSSDGAAAATAQAVKAQLAITDANLDIQTSFPVASRVVSDDSDTQSVRHTISDIYADWFLWTAVILGGGVLAFALKDVLPGGLARRASWQAAHEASAAAERTAARDDIASTADELARIGRFNEAVHLLLLTSLKDLRRQLNVTFADSLTSREILHHVTLSDAGKQAFAALVGRVEPLHFGDTVADVADYVACRDSFERLTAALAEARPT